MKVTKRKEKKRKVKKKTQINKYLTKNNKNIVKYDYLRKHILHFLQIKKMDLHVYSSTKDILKFKWK